MSETLYVKCTGCGSINRFDNAKDEQPICGNCKNRLEPGRATSDKPVAVSEAAFSIDILGAGIPVLVDFFATWCGACRSVEPALESLASRYKGRLRVATLDVDRNPEAARRYHIRGTPTLILFRDGQAAETVVGAAPERQLEDLVKKYVK